MSNGDDVLDNWEEIDEAELTTTIEKLQTESKIQAPLKDNALNRLASVEVSYANNSNSYPALVTLDYKPSTMKLLQRNNLAQANPIVNSTAVPTSPLDSMAAAFQPVMMVLHKSNDEYQSANYEQPISTQTVKILRRPMQSSEPRNNGIRPKQPIKTLQQREQEYAEARLRIMGAAKNPEDDLAAEIEANNVTTSTVTTTATPTKVNATTPPKQQNVVQNNYNNHYQQQQQGNFYHQQVQQSSPAYNNSAALFAPSPSITPQSWSPIVGGTVSNSTNALMAPYAAANASVAVTRQQQQAMAQQQQQPQQSSQDSILRMPRGPDDTLGFQPRR